MDTRLLPILIVSAIPVVIVVALALGAAVEHLAARTDEWSDRADLKQFIKQDWAGFQRWLEKKLGRAAPKVDEELVAAQRQSEAIHFLLEKELPKAISDCDHAHRMMAQITGARHMSSIAYEPELSALRSRSAWLLRNTVALLDSYPFKFEDRGLLQNAILLRKRALPCCGDECPLLHCPADEMPAHCPPNELFQIGGMGHAPCQ